VTAPTTVGVDRVGVASGSGVLARTTSALLFVPDVDPATADRLVATFFAAAASAASDDDSIVDAVSAGAVEHPSGVTGFVLITWADQLRLVVLGPVEVRTDHAGLPMLSGTGSASWVERRIRLDSSMVTVAAGAVAAPTTDLQLGCVQAAGFTAAFTAKTPTVTPTIAEPRSTEPMTLTGSIPVPTTPVTDTNTTIAAPIDGRRTAPPVDPTEPIGGDRLAALRAAVRQHDQLVDADVATTAEPTIATTAGAVPMPAVPSPAPSRPVADVDDETTLAPDDPDPDQPLSAREPAAQPADEDEDDEDRAPFVVAIRCSRGHVSPAHVAVCRVCGDLLDDSIAAESIRQPPLALLDLGGDQSMPIDRSLVLGRQPDLDAARAPERARAVVIADEASVSRTHLRIDVEDWSLTVTDCGSRSGTAIVTRPGEEPRVLEPWMPYELAVGARLFLGGPASVAIRPLTPSLDSSRRRDG
jgi:FHA domain